MTTTMAWTPLQIGDSKLSHRVVLAPLTRGRASPSERIPNTWVPNDLMFKYYTERATPGGLLITEASPVSRRASGHPGVPGWYTEEQQEGWKRIAAGVHEKGGVFFAQLWHQGRNTHSTLTGFAPLSSSAVPLEGSVRWSGVPPLPFETPKAMTLDDITETQEEFVAAAKAALLAGCDGIEIHAGNGYIFDQFLQSNINRRDDAYGGDIYKRCRFTLETVDKLIEGVGAGRVAVRLSPFGLFNQSFGEKRVEQWTYLCTELAKKGIAYVHIIEPRFDEFKGGAEKKAFLKEMGIPEDIDLSGLRQALGKTPLLSAGGHGPDNFEAGLENGSYDLVAFGRYFIANPDLVDRLKRKDRLYKWQRETFYGPFLDNEIGYTVHPVREFALATDHLKAQLAD